MPYFVCTAEVSVEQVGDNHRVIQVVIQNASLNPVTVYSLDVCCGDQPPTLVLTRYSAAATLTPLGGGAPPRPTSYSVDSPGSSASYVVATRETDTIAPNGSITMDDLFLVDTVDGHLTVPEGILLPADSCLTISTVEQVAARDMEIHIEVKEES